MDKTTLTEMKKLAGLIPTAPGFPDDEEVCEALGWKKEKSPSGYKVHASYAPHGRYSVKKKGDGHELIYRAKTKSGGYSGEAEVSQHNSHEAAVAAAEKHHTARPKAEDVDDLDEAGDNHPVRVAYRAVVAKLRELLNAVAKLRDDSPEAKKVIQAFRKEVERVSSDWNNYKPLETLHDLLAVVDPQPPSPRRIDDYGQDD